MGSPKPQPPTKPRYRKLHNIAVATKVQPWFLAGEAEFIDDCMEKSSYETLFSDTSVVGVGVGSLTFKHYLEYENMYNEALETAAFRLMYIYWAFSKEVNPKIDEAPMPQLEILEEGRIVKTPFGEMRGSLQKNGMELLAFLLTRWGRIVGVDSDNEFIYEPISMEEIYELCSPDVLLRLDDGQTVPPLMELLTLTGLYKEDTGAIKTEEGAQPQPAGN